MARLGDVATYVNGYAFKPSNWSDTGLPIIRIQDLTGNSYQANRYNGEYDKRFEVNDGDILISWSASLGVYIWTGEKAVLNQHIFKVVFDKAEVNKSFFVHQVQNILEKAASQAHGATMKHLTKPVFDALPFNLPSLAEQQHIASVLDKLSDLISLRKQQLAKLDDLVKARFVEMFGDQCVNNKHWPIVKLDSLFRISSSKRIYQNEQVQIGIPFLRISDLVQKITSGNVHAELFISIGMYNDLKSKGFVPKPNDILITSRGTLGQCYVVSEQDKFYFQDGMISWLSDMDKNVVTGYITQLFLMDGFRKQIDDVPSGTTVNYLSIERLKTLDVMLPPIELQQRFVELKDKICKNKLTIQQSLDKLEVLKKALMQEYFG